jgi:hypothetical protein
LRASSIATSSMSCRVFRRARMNHGMCAVMDAWVYARGFPPD